MLVLCMAVSCDGCGAASDGPVAGVRASGVPSLDVPLASAGPGASTRAWADGSASPIEHKLLDSQLPVERLGGDCAKVAAVYGVKTLAELTARARAAASDRIGECQRREGRVRCTVSYTGPDRSQVAIDYELDARGQVVPSSVTCVTSS
jgi:hypothetical protein